MHANLGADKKFSTPNYQSVRAGNVCSKRTFPAWHFSMMNDRNRNQAIENAIRDACVEGKVVFEIGTGAGLTAMLFAKHGADHIYTCEMNEQLQDIAMETIQHNGLGNKITVLKASSTELITSGELDFDPDIIFSETLDCGVVGEGFFSVASDIKEIATPQTVVLPGTIKQFGYLIESAEMHGLNSVSQYSKLDVSFVNYYSSLQYFPVRTTIHQSKSLSPITKIRSYSYLETEPISIPVSMYAYRDGICHGLLTHFHAFFGDHVVSNDWRDGGHWHQAYHPLIEPISVSAGNRYNFMLTPNGRFSQKKMGSNHND